MGEKLGHINNIRSTIVGNLPELYQNVCFSDIQVNNKAILKRKFVNTLETTTLFKYS